MPWVTGLIAKILVVQNSKEELEEEINRICGEFWQEIYDARDGSMHVGASWECPPDDWNEFSARSHYFVTHPVTFELPFELKYPQERQYPPCSTCGGHGEDRKEEDDNGGS